MTVEREQVHLLLDRLAPSQLAAVYSLLKVMLDPVSLAICNANIDDEPETDQEHREVAEANEWLKHNKPIPFEDVLADFGLTLADLENQKVSARIVASEESSLHRFGPRRCAPS